MKQDNDYLIAFGNTAMLKVAEWLVENWKSRPIAPGHEYGLRDLSGDGRILP